MKPDRSQIRRTLFRRAESSGRHAGRSFARQTCGLRCRVRGACGAKSSLVRRTTRWSANPDRLEPVARREHALRRGDAAHGRIASTFRRSAGRFARNRISCPTGPPSVDSPARRVKPGSASSLNAHQVESRCPVHRWREEGKAEVEPRLESMTGIAWIAHAEIAELVPAWALDREVQTETTRFHRSGHVRRTLESSHRPGRCRPGDAELG